jgi:iron complex outermembrane receptor protein
VNGRTSWTTALALAAMLAAPGFAEETAAPSGSDAAAPSTPPARAIEEIVVTAQKKQESLQDVPISITVVDGKFLQDAGIDNLHELAEYTPNVRFTTNACCTTVFVRGFGTPFAAGAFDPSVGLAIDDLSIPKEIYMSDPLFDLERFEVLRGPQGTLFGKNTSAGLFNVTTGGPTEEYTGFVLGKIGGLGVHRVEAAIGGPVASLGDFLRFRLAAVDSEQAGDVHNTALDLDEPATKQQAARLKLEIRPLSDLEVLLIGSRAITDSRFFHIQSFDFRDATVDWIRQFDPRFEDDPFNHQNSIDLKQPLDRTTDLLQTNVRWRPPDLGWLHEPEIVAVLGQSGLDQSMGLDVDFSPADVAILDAQPDSYLYDQRSIELRGGGNLAGPFGIGKLDVLVGTLLFEGHLTTDSPLRGGKDLDDYLLGPAGFELATGQPPPGGVGFADLNEAAAAFGVPPPPSSDALEGDGALFFLKQKTTSKALFGQTSWSFLDHWELSVGARLTFEKKLAHLVNQCFDPGFLCGALMIEEFDRHERRSEQDFSPKVTLRYFPWESLSLFATRAQGFKSGGFNNFSFTSDSIEVKAEKAVSWEVGARGTLFDETLSYGATLFNTDVDDLQLQNTLGALVTVRNAASARSRGLETDFRWLTPWPPLSVRGSGALTDGKFKSVPDAPPVAGSGADSQDLSGKRMPFVPQRQLNMTPELRFPLPAPAILGAWLARGLSLVTAVDLLYRSDFFLDSDLDPHTRQDDYVMLNGRIGFAAADEALALTLSVDNLTDANILEFQTDSILYPGGYVAFQEFQRTWGLQASYRW